MLSLESLEASFPQLKWSGWWTGLWSFGILVHLSKRPTIKSGLLQEHVLGSQNVQATLDQCQPQCCWHFCTRLFFVVRRCPVHCRFSSIPGLCSLDAINSSTLPLSCQNPRCLQTLPNVSWGTKVENHCPRSYRWQIPYLRFSFSFHFTLRWHLSLFQVIKRQVRIFCRWPCVYVSSCFRTSISQQSLSCHKYSYSHPRGSWEQLVTIIPMISSHLFKEHF